MPQGLEVRDAQNNIILSPDTNVLKTFGTFTIGGAGSPQQIDTYNINFTKGTPFVLIFLTSSSWFGTRDNIVPTHSFIDATTFRVRYPQASSISSYRPTGLVMYGVL